MTVARVLAAVGESLGDPKASFLAWLDKMTRLPGFSLAMSPDAREALEQMPSRSFEVDVPPLAVAERRWGAVGKKAREQLESRELEYDTFVAEAQRRRERYGAADGLRALSSLVENQPGDAVLARDVGFTAMAWGLRGQAYHIFRRVAEARPYEPQTYRALATVLAEMGYADHALAYYEVGLAGEWDSRFGEYRKILALDYLRFLRRIRDGEVKTSARSLAASRLTQVASQFDVQSADLLVSITWNTDGTDVDLHVIEPSGEECFYSHPQTEQGGRLTQDVTQGYGPEMYLLPSARSGRYRVKVKYFASDANRASARTKIYATLYENWGTKREKRTQKVVTLKYGKEMHDIATLVVR
jgi:tetratricopeptide (TPR) repeat protein